MKGIKNKKFWSLWNEKRYDEALAIPVILDERTEEDKLRMMLNGSKEEIRNTAIIASLSTGEFLHDYLMIDPRVAEGIDFARAEDLSHLFSLGEFAKGIDTSINTGDVAQLQGYAAERMVAAELQTLGHDVTFPAASNEPGFDLLVDGQPFQVKNLSSPQGVYDHLEKYPDIPVYVNSELAETFAGNDLVYATSISHETVVDATKTSLQAAGELSDFEIPLFTFLVFGATNMKQVLNNERELGQAISHTLIDSASKIAFAGTGKTAGVVAALMLFGPQAAFLGAGAGAILFGTQSHRAADFVKRKFAQMEERNLVEAAHELLPPIRLKTNEKEVIRQQKLLDLKMKGDGAHQEVAATIQRYSAVKTDYMKYKVAEMESILNEMKTGSGPILELFQRLIRTLPQTGVHPSHYQKELAAINEAFLNLKRKL